MTDKQDKIFSKGDCLSEDMLLRYLNNQLTTKEKHVVEKHTLECELCSDALEGLQLMKEPHQLKGIVENLNKKLRGAGDGRKPIVMWMSTLAIAAGLALIIGLFFIFNNRLNTTSDAPLSDNLQQKGAVNKSATDKEENLKPEETPPKTDQSATTVNPTSSSEVSKATRLEEVAVKSPAAKGISGEEEGDKLRSANGLGSLSRADAPPPPALEERPAQRISIPVMTLDNRKKSQDKNVQPQEKNMVEKDSKNQDDEIAESGNEIEIVKENQKQEPAQMHAQGEKSVASVFKKTAAPRKEETEYAITKSEKKKDKNKNIETPSPQKPSDAVNKVVGGDNGAGYANTATPASPKGGIGGSAAAPSMISQDNTSVADMASVSGVTTESAKSGADITSKPDTDFYKTELKAGKKKYRSKEFDQAVLLYTKALQTKATDREALYYLGCSYLELNKTDLAIVQFDKLINLGKGLNYDGARFNKANALIKQNKNTEAKIILEQLIQTSNEYKAKAEKALEKIK